MKNLPESFLLRMRSLLKEEFPLYEAALDQPPVKAFRVNTEKISAAEFEQICDFPLEKIPFVENGYYLNTDKIGSHPFHHAGMIYAQEPAAMIPAESLEIGADWKILDLCAAPGGKSSQLKNKLGEKGVLVANEIIPSRCRILTGNIERLGLKKVVTTCADTKKLAENFPHTFDMVMADAPCSGEGMFRKEANAASEWSEENVKKCAERQKLILENAALTLKNGGYIVYSTCTFSLEENEMVVDAFLTAHPEFELLPLAEKIRNVTERGVIFEGCKHPEITRAGRFYPHKGRGEGQFTAVLHNTSEHAEGTAKPSFSYEKPPEIVKEFLDDTLVSHNPDELIMYGGKPVFFTPDFEVKKGAFSCGVTVGEIRKGFILPHHQFFSAFGKDFKRKIELPPESEELKKYLHGEEIATKCENGWAAVTLCGCPIGGAKAVNGKAKNHYPKGLRTV